MFKLICVFYLFFSNGLTQNITNETTTLPTLSIDENVFNYDTVETELATTMNPFEETTNIGEELSNTTPLEITGTEFETTMNPFEESTNTGHSSSNVYFVIELLVQEDLKSQLTSKTPKEIYFNLINRVEIFVQNALDSNQLFGFESFSVMQMLRKDQNNLLELTCYLTYRNKPFMNVNKLRNIIQNALVLGDTSLVDIDNNNIRVYKASPGY
jgi:hypothetical protein